MRPTVCIDFDGVINSYVSGWNSGAIKDPPVEGTGEAIRSIMARYDVVVFTSRHDLNGVANYIHQHFGYTCVVDSNGTQIASGEVIVVTNYKPPAVIYIDDRGYRFRNWSSALAEIEFQEKRNWK